MSKLPAKKSGAEESIEVSKLLERLNLVENENKQLKALLEKMENRLVKLEGGKPAAAAPAAKPAPAAAKKDNDDDFDLFGDDDDNEESQRIRDERLKAYAEKKSKSTIYR